MTSFKGFPGCCGADIIHGFYGLPNSRAASQNTFKDLLIKGLKRHWYQLDGNDAVQMQYDAHDRAYFVILSSSQIGAGGWMPVLKELGFQFLARWHNSVHTGSILYLFGLFKYTSDRKPEETNKPPTGWDKLPGPLPDAELREMLKPDLYPGMPKPKIKPQQPKAA